jgi:hypothetical protein
MSACWNSEFCMLITTRCVYHPYLRPTSRNYLDHATDCRPVAHFDVQDNSQGSGVFTDAD